MEAFLASAPDWMLGASEGLRNFFYTLFKCFIFDNRWKMYLSGLKNTLLLTLFALIIGVVLGVVISLVRVVMVSMLFGSIASMFYSLAGAVLSLAGMGLLKKSGKFTEIVVSVAGGILHNIGQIAMASLILETDALRYYLPFLLVSGTVAGVVIGVISAIMVRRIEIR